MSRTRRVGRRLARTAAVLLVLVVALATTAVFGFYELSDVPSPQSLPLPQATVLEYSDGTPMARVGDLNRTIVPLSRVPDDVRWAVLAAEDRGFYSEPGVSARGMLRAVWDDVVNGGSQGGSTITQQYAKNVYLNSEQTLGRKLRELAIAVKLDREYSKDQILEYYLNTVYFGRGAYGVQAAAQAYFGVDVDRLSATQGALLAGLLQSPSQDDPAVSPERARARWRYVLDGMVATGHLARADGDRLPFPTTRPPRPAGQLGDPGPAGLVIRQVYAELAVDGISRQQVDSDGLVIRTTIDPRAQDAAVRAVGTVFTGAPYQAGMHQALVAENPADGAVLAYYGGSDGSGFDYATQGFRPPGSTFKPYTVATVLTATAQRTTSVPLAVDSLVDGSDARMVQGVKVFNDPADGAVSLPRVSVAQAMDYSLNTTFAQLAVDAGTDAVARTARAVTGVPATTSAGAPTLADANGAVSFGIGIGNYPVRPIDQATGYATLASGGTYHAPYLVQAVTDSGGAILFEHAAPAAAQVLDPRVANDVTLTLEPVAARSGTALAGGRPSAAKTGTVGLQGPDSGKPTATRNTDYGNSDAWMVGFTPQVSAAVWVGTGEDRPIVNAHGTPEYGSDLPAKTWKLFLDTYLAGAPVLRLPTTQQLHVAAR